MYKRQVLDRPAPLDGVTVEGGLLEPEYRSFVGAYPLCIRYGLTAGELACMVNAEQKLGCRLTVVPGTGWELSLIHILTRTTPRSTKPSQAWRMAM